MPPTFINIASQTLGSTSTLVTFSSIPNTYTDFMIYGSIRSAQNTPINIMRVYFNGDNTSTVYSMTQIEGSGTSAISQRTSNASDIYAGGLVIGNTGMANTFTSFQLYFPRYLVTAQYKPLSIFGGGPSNSSSGWAIDQTAAQTRTNSAISSISFTNNAQSFVAGSTFYLYGIKNS